MSSIIINNGAKNFELKFTRAAVWLTRIEHSLYAVVFMLVLVAIYLDYDSRLEVKIVIMSIVAFVFITLFIKKINVWRDYRFLVERINNEFVINREIKVNSILLSDILSKKTISMYSSRSYFNIYLRIDGMMLPIIEGVSENDKETVMRGLGVFLSGST